MTMNDDHEHEWGPILISTFTGNPHRRCQVAGCDFVSLDLSDRDYYFMEEIPSVQQYAAAVFREIAGASSEQARKFWQDRARAEYREAREALYDLSDFPLTY